MFHACVQRFDGMDEKILGEELGPSSKIFWENDTIALSFLFDRHCPIME